jgi:multidrug resistance efflux pump
MERLPPIPTPFRRKIQEFCVRVLPLLTFAGALSAVALLWPLAGGSRSAIGIAEGPRSHVVSPHPATLTSFLVPPYSPVHKGDPIAIIAPVDLNSRLDLLRSRLDLTRLATTPTLAEENAIPLERLRIDLIRTRSELAVARVRLELANRDVARNEPLARDRLVAADVFDLSRSTRDLLQAEVDVKSEAVEAVEKRLQQLESTTTQTATPVLDPALLRELTELQASIASGNAAITLHAPIDGILGDYLRQPGEFIAEGEPIAAIQREHANRIVAFLRQPFPLDPQPGLEVLVTRRTSGRPRFSTTITHVAPQFETITNALALVREGMLVDSGLPIVLTVPDPLQLRPGEIVDLVIRPQPGPTATP